jgi:hypothetical protein
MDCDIYDKVTSFYKSVTADENHRYKSWEHCYLHFMDDNASSDVDKSCLHLSFYLASWGMYRGSSFLLWKDYRIHKAVVEQLLKKRKFQKFDFSSIEDADLEKIIDLAKWIEDWYRVNITVVNDKQKQVNATDTLVTKIMLGTIGCIPAYDRYFIKGMRRSGIKYSKLSVKNLKSVSQY